MGSLLPRRSLKQNYGGLSREPSFAELGKPSLRVAKLLEGVADVVSSGVLHL